MSFLDRINIYNCLATTLTLEELANVPVLKENLPQILTLINYRKDIAIYIRHQTLEGEKLKARLEEELSVFGYLEWKECTKTSDDFVTRMENVIEDISTELHDIISDTLNQHGYAIGRSHYEYLNDEVKIGMVLFKDEITKLSKGPLSIKITLKELEQKQKQIYEFLGIEDERDIELLTTTSTCFCH